jgi:hypothetical protein
MNIAIYLIIGLVLLLVHRFTKDRFSRERVTTFIVLPELAVVRCFLWPIYFVELIMRFVEFQKLKSKKEKGLGRISLLVTLIPSIILPAATIFSIAWFQYEPSIYSSSSRLGETFESIIAIYGIAVICSSPIFWGVMLIASIVAIVTSMLMKRKIIYQITRILIGITFVIPPLFFILGIITYCGE